MIATTLYFTNVSSMADFVIQCNISQSQVDTRFISITGTLTETQLQSALNNFSAYPPSGLPTTNRN